MASTRGVSNGTRERHTRSLSIASKLSAIAREGERGGRPRRRVLQVSVRRVHRPALAVAGSAGRRVGALGPPPPSPPDPSAATAYV